jgi:uncharacterized protein (TIGR00297 family)
MLFNYWPFIAILFACMLFSVLSRKLTLPATLAGGVIACLIFLGAGYMGVAMLATFFILGSAATSWKLGLKQQLGFAEKNKGRRTTTQVMANGTVAAITGLLAWLYPSQKNLFLVMIATSFASATADTLSSELGTVYGRKFYNIITLKKDARGSDGVISIEGTIIGIIGSGLIAVIYALGYGMDKNFLWIMIAGTIGNLTDSLLGATLERKNLLHNDIVNFINTLIAAIAGLLLYSV